MKQKALRAGDAHSHEDEECRKRPRSARECAEAHSFLRMGDGLRKGGSGADLKNIGVKSIVQTIPMSL